MTEDVTLGEVGRSLQRIEARLETVTGDHESRLRKLEQWRYAIPPTVFLTGAALIAALFQ